MTKVTELLTQDNTRPAVFNHNHGPAVAARDLYISLGRNRSQFPRWAKKNIIDNPFAEKGIDWCDIMSQGKQDFVLTLDFAKRLAMMARTEKGEQIRAYFLECERQAQEAKKPRTQVELLLESVQLLHEQEKQVHHLSERVTALETNSASLGYYSIAGYAALTKRPVDLRMAAALGAKATAACRTLGAITGTIPDPRFGRVKTYPQEVLDTVFNEYFGTDARGVAHTA